MQNNIFTLLFPLKYIVRIILLAKLHFPFAIHISKADERTIDKMHETRKLPRKLNKFPVKVVTNKKEEAA